VFPKLNSNLLVIFLSENVQSNSLFLRSKNHYNNQAIQQSYYMVNEAKKAVLLAQLGEDYVVELAMRYQNPSIEAALEKVLAHSPKSLTILPLFPQYTSACNGSVYEEVNRLLAKRLAIPKVNFISSFHNYEPMIDVFVKRAKQYDIESYDHILFSYHGLPVRQMVKTDPGNHCAQSEDCCKTLTLKNQYCYSAQCYDTTYHIVEKLGLTKEQYSICFQSRLGRAPWLQPYTSDMIEHWAEKGVKRLLVFCPAFVADCLETTIEVSVEYQEEFEEMGGEHIQLVEGLNDHPDWKSRCKISQRKY